MKKNYKILIYNGYSHVEFITCDVYDKQHARSLLLQSISKFINFTDISDKDVKTNKSNLPVFKYEEDNPYKK